MKKLYSLFFALVAAITVSAQVQVSVTSPGQVRITYGAAGDYSFYDPQFAPTIYVHMWTVAADNTSGASHDDAWTNSNVMLNWSATDNAYIADVDFGTKLFTNTNTTLPAGTTVNNFGMVFKDQQNGATRQSADVQANTVGFTPTTIPVLGVSVANAAAKKAFVAEGKLYTAQKGNLTVEVYEMGGKLVKSIKVAANGNAIDLNLAKRGLYIVKVAGTAVEVVKAAY